MCGLARVLSPSPSPSLSPYSLTFLLINVTLIGLFINKLNQYITILMEL